MSNVIQQNGVHNSSHGAENSSDGVLSTARNLAGDAADKARSAVSGTASTVTRQAKHLLDRQVDKGARIVGDVGSAMQRAAEELDRTAGPLGELAHSLADRIDGYAGDLRGSSVDDLVRAASRVTRQQPALVFGLTALAGFLVLRTLKSAPSSKQHSGRDLAPTGGSDGF
jgi:hypothetical protein